MHLQCRQAAQTHKGSNSHEFRSQRSSHPEWTAETVSAVRTGTRNLTYAIMAMHGSDTSSEEINASRWSFGHPTGLSWGYVADPACSLEAWPVEQQNTGRAERERAGIS
jgi:hypothetical protein